MDCKIEKNKANCTCSYSCGKRGLCCDCVQSHLASRQITANALTGDSEKTFNQDLTIISANRLIINCLPLKF